MELKDAYNKIDNFCCSNHNSLQGNIVRYLNGREEKINMFADYQETKDDDFCKDANEMVEALETIKELVDLQEDLGCPLKVFVKALKNGIYYDDKFEHPVFILDKDNFKTKDYHLLITGTIVYLKDYQKTWWLKEDKSE